MLIKEMSEEFDLLYNQVNSNQAPGIDEFEKSQFLTKAQDEIVKAYFDPRGNKFLEGFDNGQKRQYDFSLLVVNKSLDRCTSSVDPYDPRAFVYLMPNDLFLTINESVVEETDSKKYIYQVIPITYEQYGVLMQKPYQYPTKRAVWRLITNQVSIQNTTPNDPTSSQNAQQTTIEKGGSTKQLKNQLYTCCEIIGRFKNSYTQQTAPEYRMRYVKKPTPIILVNLADEYEGLSIDGFVGNEVGYAVMHDNDGIKEVPITSSTSQEDILGIPCKLPEGIHHEIVQRAVELATAVYNPQALGTIAGVGNVSATNLGIVPRQESK